MNNQIVTSNSAVGEREETDAIKSTTKELEVVILFIDFLERKVYWFEA